MSEISYIQYGILDTGKIELTPEQDAQYSGAEELLIKEILENENKSIESKLSGGLILEEWGI